MDNGPCSQVVSGGPRDLQAGQDPRVPQVPKVSEDYQDCQGLMELQDSRAYQETQVVKDSPDPQGLWDPEDPKVQWASPARMDAQVPAACQGLSGPQETGVFLEKS